MTILIATDRLDVSADLVIADLNKRGAPLVRLDPFEPDTPAVVRISPDGRLTGTVGTVDLEDITAIWWRKPSPFISDHPDPLTARWCADEHKAGLRAALWACSARWLNHPLAERVATKPAQLVAAAHAGLRIPDTLITNDPATARAFATESPAITKTMSGPPKVDRRSGSFPLTWTRPADPEQIDDGVKATGHTFQRRIRAEVDVRLTVVGRKQFCAIAPTLGVDWRNTDTAWSILEDDAVPTSVRWGVGELMDYFHLSFAAFDFAIDARGNWTFYELNQRGEFGFVEFSTQLPISAAVADELVGDGITRPTRNPLHGRTE